MKYRLSQIQPTEDFRVPFVGIGFSIVDDHDAPIVTFGYLDPTDAANGRALMEKAIQNAVLITSVGR